MFRLSIALVGAQVVLILVVVLDPNLSFQYKPGLLSAPPSPPFAAFITAHTCTVHGGKYVARARHSVIALKRHSKCIPIFLFGVALIVTCDQNTSE